jgi:amino acid adenylation domain-containing protein
MTPMGLLSALHDLGVEVTASGDRLRYRAPEGTLTPTLRGEMAKHKNEILALLNRPMKSSSHSAGEVRRMYPTSSAQQRLWFMDQLVPDSALYNESVALRLKGTPNYVALIQTLNEMVRRHEVLRTCFEAVGGQPYQRITSPVRLELPVVDLGGLPESERRKLEVRLAHEAATRPFDLTEIPLLRSGLISLCSDEHLLLLTLHHIICDGWSKAMLVQELSDLYGSFTCGQPSALSEPELQYSDFALWQNERISRGDLDDELAYWKEQLDESLPVIDLAANRLIPSIQNYRGSSCSFKLSSQVSERIRELGRSCGATASTALLAAFQLLLGRYSGDEEVVVGIVVANRARSELQGIMGLMVNTLPIKGDLRGDPSFKQLVGRVRDSAMGAYKHQELPYEKLVAELAANRDGRRAGLEVLFVMEEGLGAGVELSGLTAVEEKVETGMAKFDLLLTLKEKGGIFEGRIEYRVDLFDGPRIRRMAESFKQLLEAAVAEPDRRVWELSLLSEVERNGLVVEWNDTEVEWANDHRVHEMFEEQAGRLPDSIAAIYEGQHLTYRELNRRANQLGAILGGLGVGPDVLVGICVARSLDLAITVLAVLKAGGAYLPLDVSYPRDRLAFMLEEARAQVLLTHQSLRGSLPEHRGTTVCIDSECDFGEEQSDENPISYARDENLAYVIYTSGSTGKPKGVSLPHRALSSMIRWHSAGLSPKPRMLQFASLSFDVSFYEMFGTWVAGGTLLIVPEELRRDFSGLGTFLSNNDIEEAVLPVVVLQQLAEEHRFRKQAFGSLRRIITTGEQLQITRPIVELFNDFALCALHNHYGPSESHVVTAHALPGTASCWPARPSIGRPIANARMYIVDQHLNPAPTGTVGELNIGGVGLARGYLNRSDLTAERFLPSQFGRSGDRLYKTGDLVRYQENGAIDYLGRIDHQVKIRGFRVEPGEVEAVLEQHSAVREAVVVSREGSTGDKRLIAYVACDRKQGVTTAELSAYSKEALPDHMVPAAFIIVGKLPLTPNGKIDRAALRVSYQPAPELPVQIEPPGTPAEEVIARICSDVLGFESVGVDSNFFDLGGHSLLATQVILRLREIFRVEVPVRLIFDSPTVKGMVEEVARLWKGREIVEEIAWTWLQVEQLSDSDVNGMLND